MSKLLLSSVLLSVCCLFSCGDDEVADLYYRDEMRDFVIRISEYSKAKKARFAVIPQNGIELVTLNGEEDGELSADYLSAIDGHGQEDLHYGYDKDDVQTPTADEAYVKLFLNKSKQAGNTILVTDYCWTQSKMTNSYAKNNAGGYIGFAADERELNNIPSYPATLNNENKDSVTALWQVKNFLYLINLEKYTNKQDFISAVFATNYDLLIMDLFLNDTVEFTSTDIEQLRSKANGGRRMVVCYLSIGEAEDYRFYWDNSWSSEKPTWLDEENSDWEGNYKVKYWEVDWQNIIFGSNGAYLNKIIAADFDGVYLDIIDAFEYYE